LQATFGLSINQGLDTHQAKTRLDNQMAQLDDYLSHFTATRASVAVRRNHLSSRQEGLDERTQSLEDATDELQKADIDEAAMKYYAAQNYYEATLSSTSRVITTSILNYLR
jgi:flagellin-like hook-associated protein FlgL